MIEYTYSSTGNESADWLVDKILENKGIVSNDSFSGNLIEGKATKRKITLEFDALIIEIGCVDKEVEVAIFANDGRKQLLMESSKALLTHRESAIAILIDYNKTVKEALNSLKEARMRQAMAMGSPIVKPRK